MKKTIFWDFKEKPLNIDNLKTAQCEISAAHTADKETSLSLVNVDSNDLQLISNALNMYHRMGKEMRDMMTEIEKLHKGQKLVFDKQDDTKKHNDHVVSELQKVTTLMNQIPDSNRAMTQEVIELNKKLKSMVEEKELVKV